MKRKATDSSVELIMIKVVCEKRDELNFRMNKLLTLGNLKKLYSDHIGVPLVSLRFFFDKHPIADSDTPASLKMNKFNLIIVSEEPIVDGGDGWRTQDSPENYAPTLQAT